MGEFAVSIKHSEAKSVSASGGLRPLTPRPRALPLDPAGGSAPRPPVIQKPTRWVYLAAVNRWREKKLCNDFTNIISSDSVIVRHCYTFHDCLPRRYRTRIVRLSVLFEIAELHYVSLHYFCLYCFPQL